VTSAADTQVAVVADAAAAEEPDAPASRLAVGHVAHRRTRPVENGFRYPVYFLYLDLDELPELDRRLRYFGHNHAAPVTFYDRDHGPRDGSPLKPWFEGLLSDCAGIDLGPGGRVRVLSFPKVLGFGFWPVSFWYGFSGDGVCRAVMAEVQNTFRDHHNYLLHDHGRPFDFAGSHRAVKAFYVSPFIRVPDMHYDFRFTQPGDRISASIADIPAEDDGQKPLLTAAISLETRPLTDRALLRQVFRLGPMSVRALILIHLQALKLWRKRVRFYSHSQPPSWDTSRMEGEE